MTKPKPIKATLSVTMPMDVAMMIDEVRIGVSRSEFIEFCLRNYLETLTKGDSKLFSVWFDEIFADFVECEHVPAGPSDVEGQNFDRRVIELKSLGDIKTTIRVHTSPGAHSLVNLGDICPDLSHREIEYIKLVAINTSLLWSDSCKWQSVASIRKHGVILTRESISDGIKLAYEYHGDPERC